MKNKPPPAFADREQAAEIVVCQVLGSKCKDQTENEVGDDEVVNKKA